MTGLTALSAGPARLELAPALGGGIARLDVGGKPLLRPWSGGEANPFSLASNILTPFSNRISGGGFEFEGRRHRLAPNLTGESCPIHGDGFQKAWTAEIQDEASVRLTLRDGAIGPYRYRAEQAFRLLDTRLRVDLSVTSGAEIALPFGCGFHPWFPRDGETRLSFAADQIWLEDEDHLPAGRLSLAESPEWSFAAPRALPDGWINNGYAGWKGRARIEQGPMFASAVVGASPNLSTAIVYSPDATADFFCFEPTSHPVDAFNLPGRPGLAVLTPGQTMTAWMEIEWG